MTDALSLARDLLRCPSVTPADAGALAVLENLLRRAGFEVHRVTFSELGAADIDNLYARIGNTAPHITFAGHTDVVPAGDETAWSHGAFAGDVKDGLLYGRGAVDMKGGIACSGAAVLDFSRLNVAVSDEPLDHGSAQFQASNLEFTSVDVGNAATNVIPGQAQAKFNIRFNDNHSHESLRQLVEQRLAK